MAKIGAPSKFRKSYVKAANNYVDQCIENNEIPFVEELTELLDINEETIYSWIKKPDLEPFAKAVKRIKSVQKRMFQTKGLNNEVNTAMAIFLLKNNHGFTDRVDHNQLINGRESDFMVIYRPKKELEAPIETVHINAETSDPEPSE